MTNKKWDYVVVYVDPADIAAGKTPAQRGELETTLAATTVNRALNMAKKSLAEQHDIPAKDLVILDVIRERSPLVAEWAE